MQLIPLFAARRPLATCAAAVLAAGLSVGVAVAPPHLSDPGPGQAVVTAQFIAAQKAVQASTPTIAGTPKVGVRLTANPRAWTPGTRLTYQWYAGGKAVKGATARTFTPGAAHVNKPIQVRVAGSKAGYASAAKMSRATGKVAKGTLKAPTPTIAGTAKSGVKLTANPGAWTSGTALKYQWLAGGAAVKGATARTFTPAAAHVNKTIQVRVTGTKTAYVTAAKTSKATSKVAPPVTGYPVYNAPPAPAGSTGWVGGGGAIPVPRNAVVTSQGYDAARGYWVIYYRVPVGEW